MAEPFLGQIALFPYNYAPKNWADCAGQILPISQYTALFSLLGTQYGGNGTSNFALPDLQGRIPVGQGNGPGLTGYVAGEDGGTENVSLTTAEMAAHNHPAGAIATHGTTNAAAGNVLAQARAGGLSSATHGYIYNPGAPDTALQPQQLTTAGGSQPHNNLQPYLTLRYCIALSGVFPSRG